MMAALLRVPLYRLMHAFGFPRLGPINVTVSTTFRCNSRCLTCNVYERPVDEMSYEEWDRAFAALGRGVTWFTFSGGEPFLRKDLPEIVAAAWRRCRPRVVNIPTNGTYPDRVVAGAERLSRLFGRRTQLVINVSLDAEGERNDVLRGLTGDWDLARETLRRLKALHVPNLTVGIHTVVSRHNVQGFPGIADRLMALEPDQYIAEPAEERLELQTMGTGITPPGAAFETAVRHLETRSRAGAGAGLPRLTRAIRLVYYRIALETIRRGEQVIPCYAGIASAHIAPNGDVWACCTKAKPLGNLKRSGFRFDAVWSSEEARRERRSIRNRECACPLASASYTSILCDVGALTRVGAEFLGRRARSPEAGSR